MTNQNSKPSEISGFITVDGIKLNYLIEGSGIPCLVITHQQQHRATFSSELKKHLRFIFVDIKIFVPSIAIEIEKITMDSIVNDIEKIRITLGFDRIAVLGPSAFGLIALEYARKYPKHTSHVIMIGTFPNYNSEIRKKINEFWEIDASEERKNMLRVNDEALTDEILIKEPPAKAFVLQYVAHTPAYWFNPSHDGSWLWEGIEYNMGCFNHFIYGILEEYDSTQSLQELTIPLFLALGRYDYAAPYILWENLLDGIPNLSYNLFQKSGHFPMFEEQTQFDKKLIEWIENL